MEQKEWLEELYELARQNKLVRNKGEFANLIGIDSASLSHALKDDGKVSVANAITRAEHALMKARIPIGGGNTTNVNVDMGDSIHHNSAPVVARGANKTPASDILAEKDRQIKKMEAEIQSLKEQVSDLTKSILNLTTKNFKP